MHTNMLKNCKVDNKEMMEQEEQIIRGIITKALTQLKIERVLAKPNKRKARGLFSISIS